MRKFLALALVAVLALSSAFMLMSCGGQQPAEEQATEQPPAEAPVDTTGMGMDTTATDTTTTP